MTNAVYEQETGEFTIYQCDDGGIERVLYECTGYAGRDAGKNRPHMQHVKSTGPIPCGIYMLQEARHHPRLGPLAFPLNPHAGNAMFERSGFYIHGDSLSNPGNASHGCIVLSRADREAIDELNVCTVTVVPGYPALPGTRRST